MRPILASIALAAALALAASAAAAPPAAPDPVQLYYPPAALGAGLGGQATIACAHDAQAALKDCTLVSETPAGQGFGPAALAMAAASRGNPKLAITDPGFLAPSQLTLTFVADPPSITPDITRTPHTLTQPEVVSAPTAEALQRDYPAPALAAHIAGHVVLGCRVTLAGKLADCAVLQETPPGQDFAAAALRLTPDFVMKPMLRDGEPVDGGKIILPIGFGPH